MELENFQIVVDSMVLTDEKKGLKGAFYQPIALKTTTQLYYAALFELPNPERFGAHRASGEWCSRHRASTGSGGHRARAEAVHYYGSRAKKNSSLGVALGAGSSLFHVPRYCSPHGIFGCPTQPAS